MINNLATSSISIVLDKINIEEFNPKPIDSSDQNLSNLTNNDIDNNEEQLSIDDIQNTITINDLSEEELNKLNFDLQVKPPHWNDDYWQDILNKYKWFMHKDNYIGCKICYNIKAFMGKKSLIGCMKLFLMDLSYEDLEIKLSSHDRATQHNKSIVLLKAQLENKLVQPNHPLQSSNQSPPMNPIISRKSRSIDHYCPFCKKGYRLKKALAKHIYNCTNETATSSFSLLCSCADKPSLVSIRSIDEHNSTLHANRLLFTCKFCNMEFKQTTVLFGHLLLFHDFYWNPYEDMPELIETPGPEMHDQISGSGTNINLGNRPERKRSSANALSDSIWLVYGAKDSLAFQKPKDVVARRPYRKRQFKESGTQSENVSNISTGSLSIGTISSDIRIERVINENNNEEVSKLTIGSSSIHTCEYCGGRYVSADVLALHMSNYHSIVPQMEREAEEQQRQHCIKQLKKIVGMNYHQQSKTAKSTYIRLSNHMRKVRALQMKKKFNLGENHSKTTATTTSTTKMSHEKNLLIKKASKIKPAKDGKSKQLQAIAKRNKVSASMLKCPACQILFASLDQRFEHVSIHHAELEKFSCKICGLIFTNQKTYRQHVEKTHHDASQSKPGKTVTQEKTYSCDSCHLVFTNQADLLCHTEFSHPAKPCEDGSVDNNGNSFDTAHNCDIDYVEPVKPVCVVVEGNELDMLITAESGENLVRCTSCDIEANNEFELLVHSFSHSEVSEENEQFQICPNCSRMFFGKHGKIYLKDHYNSEHLKKALPSCGSCKLSFSSSFVLEKHQVEGVCQSVAIDEPYESLMSVEKFAFSCSQCGMIFAGQSSKQRFDVHMEKCSLELMNNELLDS